MSGRSPSKRGRKKKSNKGRKPKKPLSKEEIAAKKNQKNMRETCRRVEINLHYELLYHSLGQNLVYNRAERVQLLRKAIIKMAELKAQVTSLSDQLRAAGMTPRTPPKFQLNDSQKLFMLVQRWARNDNGKKCSRAKLKPVGIEIIDDDENVPITIPLDGHTVTADHLGSDDNDHIPFWASWETTTYVVVDQDAFEKACNQAIIAGWDGKLGSKGAYYQVGLPDDCGLTIAASPHIIHNNTNNNNNNHNDIKIMKRRNNKHHHRRSHHEMDEDEDDSDEDDEDNEDEDELNNHHNMNQYHHHHHHHRQQHISSNNGHHHHHNHHHSNHMVPTFPPRIDFPEIVVRDLQAHSINNHSSDSRSENNSTTTSEPPIKKQKLSNGRCKNKRKRETECQQQPQQQQQQTHNQFNITSNGQFLSHSLPLSVPLPAVNGPSTFVLGAMNPNPIHPMSTINGSPFMNIRINNNSTPEQVNQSSSDTGSQHSHSNNNNNNNMNNHHRVKSEPLNDNITPQSTPSFPITTQVQLPHFLAAFPPHPTLPTTHQFSSATNNNSHSLVPVATFPMYGHPINVNNLHQQQRESNNSTPSDNKDNIITKDNKDNIGIPPLPPISSITTSINLPPLPSNHNNHSNKNDGICTTISTNIGVDDDEDINIGKGVEIESNNDTESTPPPSNSNNMMNNMNMNNNNNNNNNSNLSPSGSRTSHETRNSVVFTPANHSKNSSAISTDSNTPDGMDGCRSHSKSPRPRPEKHAIHLPDNTNSVSFLNRTSRSVATTPSIDNYVNELNWNNNNTTSTPQGNLVIHSDEYNSYDVIPSHHIGMMNEIPVSGFQDASTSTNHDDSNNGMKGSVFYG